MTQTSEKQSQTEQPESPAPSKKSSRKSILAFAVFVLDNTAAAVHTCRLPAFHCRISAMLLCLIQHLAELLPHRKFRSYRIAVAH